ncbi:Lipoprotein OS=Streptomyces tendae OX=1932 GN=GUR47_09660 PE=4 SV=1 [Streptomyces tendae]
MGALRRIWRTAAVVVGSAVAVGGLVACEPGGLSSASVAYTTDQTVTRELERQKAEVRWLTCTASFGDKDGTASATENTVASVHCEGRTDAGQDITVDGEVTRVVNGACVRGNLTAKVDGKEWFRVKGLGDCDATSAPPANRPSPNGPGPTVTVTRTIWCPDDPHCRPVEGK